MKINKIIHPKFKEFSTQSNPELQKIPENLRDAHTRTKRKAP